MRVRATIYLFVRPRPKTLPLLAILFCLALSNLPGEPTPWTHQEFADDPGEFRFAVVSDRAANPREGVFEAALKKLELLRPLFVLCVGDLVQGYGEGMSPLTDEALVRERRHQVDEWLTALPVPFYRVAGNHDINTDLGAAIWKELYGNEYYSFSYQNVLFLCLNSQDGPNHKAGIGEGQIAWAKETLEKHPTARHVCVFMHMPLWLDDEKRLEKARAGNGQTKLTGFDRIEKLLEGRSCMVFAGHHHRYGKWTRNGNKYFRLATTGGQSGLAGPEKGQFDHVMWVTMTRNGPVVCNLMLDGILDEDAKANMPAEVD